MHSMNCNEQADRIRTPLRARSQFSWDQTLFVTSCTDQHVRLFRTKTLELLHQFNSERPLNSASISPLAHCPYFIVRGRT